ncbi:MAG: hypothetical protein HYT72_04350 [Candidatus Aenigmarchaeota archaeon]|nr:hypothetical protein [Candidatus Aenigmarchaeota archaeon]
MSKLTDQLTQALADANQRNEALSELVRKYPADLAEILTRLDAMINGLPEQWRPPALLEFRQYVQGVAGVQQTVAPESIGADGAHPAEPVIVQQVVQTAIPAPQEILLPSSLQEGTLTAKYYSAIGRGIDTKEKLGREFPGISVNFMLYVLMGEKRLVEYRDGVLTIKPEAKQIEVSVPQEIPLPFSLTEKEAEVYAAIRRGNTLVKDLKHKFPAYGVYTITDILYRLKEKGAIESDGRGKVRIKGSSVRSKQGQMQGPDSATVSSRTQPTAPMTTSQAKAIVTAYVKEHPYQEISYDAIHAVIPGVTGKQFGNVMTRMKSQPEFSGSWGRVKYEGAQPARQTEKAGPKPAVISAPTQTTPAEALAKVKGYLTTHPGEEIDYKILRRLFPGITDQLFWNTMTRIKQLGEFSGNWGTVMYEGVGGTQTTAAHTGKAVTTERSKQDAHAYTTKPGSIADRLLSYVNGLEGEVSFDEIIRDPQFSGLNPHTLAVTLDKLKRHKLIEGGTKKAKKRTQSEPQQAPVPEYRDAGALPDEVTAQAGGAQEAVHEPPTPVEYKEATPSAAIRPSLSIDAVIEYLGRLSGRLLENQADRLEDYAVRVAPPDGATPEQVEALNNVGRTLERFLDKDGDIDRFLAELEKTGTNVPDVTRYLDSLRTESGSQAPTSGNNQHPYVTEAPQNPAYATTLSSYYEISRRMDASLSRFQETAEQLPEEQSRRIERVLLDKVLPEDTETVGDEYAHALDALRTALEGSLRSGDAERLIRYLEAQEKIDPDEMETYLAEFSGPVATTALVPHVRNAVQALGPADLTTDLVWGPLFSKNGSPQSEIVRTNLPYIAERDSRLPAALKRLIPKSGSDWAVYAIGQISGFLRAVEENYGNISAKVTGGLLTLLNHPDNQHYLGAFLHAVGGKKPYISVQQGVACLEELNIGGDKRALTVLRKYAIHIS